MDQDEAGTNSIVPDTAPASREDTEPPTIKGEESKPATPKPHPLSISFQPPTPPPVLDDGLDASLQPTEGVLDGVVGDIGGDIALDLTEIGPDGEPFDRCTLPTRRRDRPVGPRKQAGPCLTG